MNDLQQKNPHTEFGKWAMFIYLEEKIWYLTMLEILGRIDVISIDILPFRKLPCRDFQPPPPMPDADF